jgi:hypothetical protein
VARTRDIFRGIGFRVMMAVLRHPRQRRSRSVEDREKDQDVFNHRIQSQGAVSQAAVIANRGPNPTDSSDRQGYGQHAPTRQGEQDQPDQRQSVNHHNVK